MSLKRKEFFPISNGTDLTVRTEVEDKPARKLERQERNEFSPLLGGDGNYSEQFIFACNSRLFARIEETMRIYI